MLSLIGNIGKNFMLKYKGVSKIAKILTEEEMKTLPYVIAVDFDGTLVEHTYKGIGTPKRKVVDYMIQMKSHGVKIILWTCRDNDNEDKELDAAVQFCKELGLEFDAVNDNIQEVKNLFQANMRKVYANLYVDDKNGVLFLGVEQNATSSKY